jgi:hypothetical protein
MPEGWEGRSVGWVRVVTSRVPALEALTEDDLAIVPVAALAAIRERGVDSLALADEMARGGAAGALVVRSGEAARDDDAALFAARATGSGLPVLEVEAGDAAALERSVIGYLVNARAELERQAATLEGDLERIALSDAGADALAAGIARFLGRSVAIEGSDGEPLSVHAPERVPKAAAAAGGYLANRRHVAYRRPLPSASDTTDGGVGSLVLLGDPNVGELDRIVADRVAGLVALELARRAPRDEPGTALPADGPPWVVIVARQLGAGAPSSTEQRERLRERLRRLAPARRLGLRGTAASLELRLVAAVTDGDEDASSLVARIAAALARPVAVSLPFASPDDRAAAEAGARETLHAWERLVEVDPSVDEGNSGARVVRADRLPVFRLLGGLHNLPDGRRQARALLAPLMSASPSLRAERLRTLRALLDAPGPVEAAARLGVHRNTIGYRLSRIESTTGWRLDDPELRLALSLAVRLVQSDQESED